MEYLQRAAVAAKAAAKQAKYQMAGLTEIEIKTLECTNSDPWGAHGKDLAELARATRNREDMYLIMKTLWHRLDGRDDQWRHVYKALTVMEFLVAQGAEDVTRELRDSLRTIERLQDFHYKEPNGRDQGINVREKSKNLVKLLNDPSKIAEMRDKAIANRGKYGGISADDYRSGNVRAHVPHARSHSDDASHRSSAFSEDRRDASADPRSRGNGAGYAAPAAPAPAPALAPAPAAAEAQPSFANFDDADDGDFEDDTASRRPGGFVPKIQLSAPSSPAPARPAAALAPPPGANGAARGNLFAAPVVAQAVGGGSTMDDLFGGMTTAATTTATATADPFGDFAAAATVKATTPAVAAAAVPDFFGLDDPAPAPAPAVGNGATGGGMGAMSGLTGGYRQQPAGGAMGGVGGMMGGYQQPLGGGMMGGYQQQPVGGVMGGYQQQPVGGVMGGYQQPLGGGMGVAPGGAPPMMGGMPQMPQMSQMGGGMNGAARAPSDPFAHSLSQPASAVSSPAPKGHKRVSSTGNDALDGLAADFLSMGVGARGASGAKPSGGPMNGGAMNAGNRGTPMRPNSGSLI